MRPSDDDWSHLALGLESALKAGRLQDARQPLATHLALGIRVPGQTWYLHLHTAPGNPSAYLKSTKPANAQHPSAFLMKCRKELNGARVTAVAARGEALQFAFARKAAAELEVTWTLVAEVDPRYPGLFLLDESQRVVVQAAAARPKSLQQRNGKPYEPPEPSAGSPRANQWVGTEPEVLFERLAQAAEGQAPPPSGGAAAKRHRSSLKRAIASARRKVTKIEQDFARASQADQYERTGRLLSYHLHALRRGQGAVRLVDYENPEQEEVEVELDPLLEPAVQMKRLFDRAKRLRAALGGIESRLNEAKARLAELEAVAAKLREAEIDTEAAVALIEESGVAPQEKATELPRAQREARRVYREFTADDGTSILVGKGARENDELTLRIAKADDLWLHATGRRGAHVILRCQRDRSPHPEALQDAAVLAAWYAEGGKGEGAVEVAYTRRRHVHKRKGFAPGMVSHSQVKTIFVAMDEARLNRLFGRA